jgi:hypothetical protein
MEVWKKINEFDNYEISSFGNVRSLMFNKIKILNGGIDKSGYKNVCICKDKKHYTKLVHQLVAIAFLNHIPCGKKLVVNHKDFNKLNNNINNLEIVSFRENTNKKHLKSSSKYTGVCFYKKTNKWLSSIQIKGKSKHIGLFDNELEASKAYQKELKKISGELKTV